MKLMKWLFGILIIMGITTTAYADTILLNDDFNSENLGTGWAGNYTSFSNWIVTDGYVDLAGYGSWDFLGTGSPYGVYVDLDGSNNKAGTLRSRTDFILAPGTLLLQFDLAGSQRGEYENYRDNKVNVKLGTLYDETFTPNANDLFTTYSRYINIVTATNAYLIFQNMPDGTYDGDNIGALLDNVKLTVTTIPEPATLMMFGLGLLGVAGVSRRKKSKNI